MFKKFFSNNGYFCLDKFLNATMFAIYYTTFLSLFAYFGHWQTGIFYTAFIAILCVYCVHNQTDGYDDYTEGDDIVRLHAVGGYIVCLIIYAYYCINILKLQGSAAGFTIVEFVILIGCLAVKITINKADNAVNEF